MVTHVRNPLEEIDVMQLYVQNLNVLISIHPLENAARDVYQFSHRNQIVLKSLVLWLLVLEENNIYLQEAAALNAKI